MRALIFDNGLRFAADYPRPLPRESEALVRVIYAGICATDREIMKGYMGFSGVPGHEFSGVVEEAAEKSLLGKRVTGSINIGCRTCPYCASGLSNHCPDRDVLGILNKDGAFAEFLTLPLENIYLLPDSVSLQEGVFAEPLAAAFEITRQVKVSSGMKAAVLGDGKLGLLATLVLQRTGCDLTLIGRHGDRLTAFKEKGMAVSPGVKGLSRNFDITVDCTGSEAGLVEAISITKPRGIVVLKSTIAKRNDDILNQVVIDEITLIGSRCGPFEPAISAIAEGSINVRPFISAVFPLEDGLRAMEEAAKPTSLKVLLKIDNREV
jgi:threonine dehydrogenase-like Zn-dependent dehydrogenase